MGIGLNAALYTGVNALEAQSLGVQVAGQNIANANTPGATRQVVDIEEAGSVQTVQGDISLGAYVNQIRSIRSDFLDNEVQQQTSVSNYSTISQQQLQLLESNFGEDITNNQVSATSSTATGSGIQGPLDNFYQAWQSLASDPTNSIYQDNVSSSSSDLANQITGVYNQILNSKANNFTQASDVTLQINTLATQIAQINTQISLAEGQMVTTGQPGIDPQANNLRDQRQELIQELAQYIPIKEDENQGPLQDQTNIEIPDANGNSQNPPVYLVFQGYGAGANNGDLPANNDFTTVRLDVVGTDPTSADGNTNTTSSNVNGAGYDSDTNSVLSIVASTATTAGVTPPSEPDLSTITSASPVTFASTQATATPSGSAFVNVSSTSGFAVGQTISGPGIPAGTTITSIASGVLDLSANTTSAITAGAPIGVVATGFTGLQTTGVIDNLPNSSNTTTNSVDSALQGEITGGQLGAYIDQANNVIGVGNGAKVGGSTVEQFNAFVTQLVSEINAQFEKGNDPSGDTPVAPLFTMGGQTADPTTSPAGTVYSAGSVVYFPTADAGFTYTGSLSVTTSGGVTTAYSSPTAYTPAAGDTVTVDSGTATPAVSTTIAPSITTATSGTSYPTGSVINFPAGSSGSLTYTGTLVVTNGTTGATTSYTTPTAYTPAAGDTVQVSSGSITLTAVTTVAPLTFTAINNDRITTTASESYPTGSLISFPFGNGSPSGPLTYSGSLTVTDAAGVTTSYTSPTAYTPASGDTVKVNSGTITIAAGVIISGSGGTDAGTLTLNPLYNINTTSYDRTQFPAAAAGAGQLDGSNANAIYQLSQASVTNGLTNNPTSYRNVISQIGSNTASSIQVATQNNLVLQQTTTQQQSVEGINMDEELTNLTTYQQAYNASAQFISTINTMLTTTIDMISTAA